MTSRLSDHWETARRQARVFDRYLDSANGPDTDIELAAREIGLSVRPTYELLAKYRTRRLVSDLVPKRRERSPRLLECCESVIVTVLNGVMGDVWQALWRFDETAAAKRELAMLNGTRRRPRDRLPSAPPQSPVHESQDQSAEAGFALIALLNWLGLPRREASLW